MGEMMCSGPNVGAMAPPWPDISLRKGSLSKVPPYCDTGQDEPLLSRNSHRVGRDHPQGGGRVARPQQTESVGPSPQGGTRQGLWKKEWARSARLPSRDVFEPAAML